MPDEQINKLADVVRQASFDIHKFHRHGHLEKIYENALAHRPRKLGFNVDQQFQFRGTVLIILQISSKSLKLAAKGIIDEHIAQY